MDSHKLFGPYWFSCGTSPVHHIYCVKGSDLVGWRRDKTLGIWSLNRKRDHGRIREIKAFQDKRGHMNGTIHFAELEDEGIVCYEGNHRFWAVSDDIEYVMIDVIWNATEDQVYEEFNAINSALPVPKIMKKKLDAPGVVLRKRIEEYVIDICEMHPKLASTKDRANRPRFLRADLIDRIGKQYKFFSTSGGYTIDEFFTAINHLNEAIGNGVYEVDSNLKPSSRKVAEASGFYLYIANEPLSRQDLRWALTECDNM